MAMGAEEATAAEGGIAAAAPISFSDDDNETVASDDDASSSSNAAPDLTHTDLFAAVEESILSCRPLVNFFFNSGGDTNLTKRQRRDAICDIVRSPKFNKARARRLFAGLTPLLKKVSEEETYLPDEDEDGNIIKDSEADSIRAVRYLRCCAFLVEAYLDGILARQSNNKGSGRRSGGEQTKKKIEVIDEVFEVAEMLHDLLFPLQGPSSREVKEATQAQSAIFAMCEKWWHGNFEDREQMVTQLIPLLLLKTLEDTAQKNDVKRLYSIREAIDLLDFEDESIASLKTHLLRTVNNPLFLQSVEGRKFIAHLFQVDASLVGDLHLAVRAQIPGAKKSILNAYANIYYSAWKRATEKQEDGEEEIQTSIEENALQPLMLHVIQGGNASTVKSVRVILDKFYLNKKSPDVEGMLHRMYGRLLWRALSSANARVRIQASVVLADTFPLIDPEASEEWTEACVEKSMEALISLMKDDVPSVRVAGSRATAKILSLFWAAVPSKDIRALLNHIIARHASDATSPAVRAAAVDAITTLLEEEKTHAVLRPLLPNVGNLVHDKTEKVRLAVVNLLLCVKRMRGMKYYHVVPANNLLARLAEEGRGRNNPCGPVARSLSDLLSNSFFPIGNKKTMTDIINRTMRLLSDNPEAAITFYRNASSQLSVNSICRLIAALMKCLCYFIVEEKRNNCEDVSNLSLVVPEDESIVSKGDHSDTSLMATIAESISILWESVEAGLKDGENEHAQKVLMDVVAGDVLTEVYCHFESKLENENLEDEKSRHCYQACMHILNCAGKVDESKVEGLRSHIIGELSKTDDMTEEERMKADFSPNVALLCAWGMTEEVVECIASSITLYFEGAGDDMNVSFTRKSAASRKRKQRGSKTKGAAPTETLPEQLHIDICWGILGNMLKGSDPASKSLTESILKSETAFNILVSALETAKIAAERMMKPNDDSLSIARATHMGVAIEFYGRLLVHKEDIKGEIPLNLTPELKSLLSWATDAIVPSLLKLDRRDNTLRDLDLSSIMSLESPITSPVSGGPFRKMGRHSSPVVGNIGDASFMSDRRSNVFGDKATLISTRAVTAFATIPIICTFAQWLSIGCSHSFVGEHIMKLCKLLECSDKTVRKTFLPVLIYIAINCQKSEGDSALMKQVLLSLKGVDPTPTEEGIISDSTEFLLSTLRDEYNLKAAISTFVHVTSTTVVEAEEDEYESASDTPLIKKIGVCMQKVLGSLIRDKRSSLVLAQCLVDECMSSELRECLFKELECHAPKTKPLNKILHEWATKNSTKDSAVSPDKAEEGTNDNLPEPEPILA